MSVCVCNVFAVHKVDLYCKTDFACNCFILNQNKDYDLVVDEDQINFVMAEQIPGTKEKQVRSC